MNIQDEKLKRGLKRSNIIFYVIVPSIFLLLFLIAFLADDWRKAKKELTLLIPREELFNDTIYNSDPSYKGNFIVYYLKNKSLKGLDQNVSNLEGFCKPYDDIRKVIWKISQDRRPLNGLAFDPYNNSKNNSELSDIKILAIAKPFIINTHSETNAYVTVHIDPLSGKELYRSSPYLKTDTVGTYGIELWMYDLKNRDVIYHKYFYQNNDNNPIEDMYYFLSKNCKDDQVKNE